MSETHDHVIPPHEFAAILIRIYGADPPDGLCADPRLVAMREATLRYERLHAANSDRLPVINEWKSLGADVTALRLALETATRERDNWIETARTYAEGEDYYRSLIDKALKDEPSAYVADDGAISEDVLRAKLPEMYALAVSERKRAEAEFDRLRQDRYDALNAQTTEGLSAAEWQLRTGKAERERDEARALAVSWEREFNVANHERLRLWDEAESFCEKLDQFEANGFPNVASVMDRIAVLSRARETDGAVREAALRDEIAWLQYTTDTSPLARLERVRVLYLALSSTPRPATKDDDKGGAA